MRYLGCKTKLIPFIKKTVDDILAGSGIVFDTFSGTGTVSDSLKSTYTMVACDILHSSSIITKCKTLINKENITFTGITDLLKDKDVFHYLNSLVPIEGFIWKTYSPKGDRKFFSEENSKIIDAILSKAFEWKSSLSITELEHTYIIGCLLESISLVANTAGTYGAFNKQWDPRAEKKMVIMNHFKLDGSDKHKVYTGNSMGFIEKEECDLLYMDPPYNSRQYGSYYHVLETIARNDTPDVHGITGLRDWSDTKSNYCINKLVENELSQTLKSTKAKHVVMSYSNEGIMSKDTILEIMKRFGEVSCDEIPHDRYNARKSNSKKDVKEYLFKLKLVQNIVPAIGLPAWYNTIYNEDCIAGMKKIADKSIQLILTDLPYGLTECKWDSVIPLADLWKEYKRIIKPSGAIVLFGQQPFTSCLIASNYEMFKYSLVWKKTKTGNFAQAPYRFLSQHEDIAVFSYGKVAKNGNPRMAYYPQGTIPCNKVMKGKTGTTEHREGRNTQSDYVQTVTNYPRSILEFGNEGKPEHPTQKPVDLCEYLIKSYSAENDIVLDSCMGSGTTAVAAIRTKRIYVGFEKDKEYYDIAMNRIKKA
jgi:adenine-specific DNA methylase